jgi:hypothetical protein
MMKDLLKMNDYNLILVDTMNLAARSFYGMKNLSWKGKPTGMLYGVAKFAFKCRSIYPRSRVVFLWEGTNSRRKSMDDSYKSSRTQGSDFRSQVHELKPFLENMNVDQMWHIGLEADDLAGYMVHTLDKSESALLVSCDEDWFQFMRPGRVDLQRGDLIETYDDLKDSLGFPPDRIGIWKILKGDKSDEIKGIKNFPSSVGRLLTNRCADFKDVLNYPLHKHNEKWLKYEKEITENWTMLQKNAELIIFNPDWIETSQIICKHGAENKQYLIKALQDNGINSLLKGLT